MYFNLVSCTMCTFCHSWWLFFVYDLSLDGVASFTICLFWGIRVVCDLSLPTMLFHSRYVAPDEVASFSVFHSWRFNFVLFATRNPWRSCFIHGMSPLTTLFRLRSVTLAIVIPFTVCHCRQSHFVHNLSPLTRLRWQAWSKQKVRSIPTGFSNEEALLMNTDTSSLEVNRRRPPNHRGGYSQPTWW